MHETTTSFWSPFLAHPVCIRLSRRCCTAVAAPLCHHARIVVMLTRHAIMQAACVSSVITSRFFLLTAEYCNERVCLCVQLCMCLSAIVSSELHEYTSDLHQIFCACYLWPWLGSVLAAQWYAMNFRFMDDVIFAHEPRLLNVAAQLMRSAHAALGLAINSAQ